MKHFAQPQNFTQAPAPSEAWLKVADTYTACRDELRFLLDQVSDIETSPPIKAQKLESREWSREAPQDPAITSLLKQMTDCAEKAALMGNVLNASRALIEIFELDAAEKSSQTVIKKADLVAARTRRFIEIDLFIK